MCQADRDAEIANILNPVVGQQAMGPIPPEDTEYTFRARLEKLRPLQTGFDLSPVIQLFALIAVIGFLALVIVMLVKMGGPT